jgi:hypothetical protein
MPPCGLSLNWVMAGEEYYVNSNMLRPCKITVVSVRKQCAEHETIATRPCIGLPHGPKVDAVLT